MLAGLKELIKVQQKVKEIRSATNDVQTYPRGYDRSVCDIEWNI